MAKTTATVTVGADTSPFQKAMKGLGGSLTAKRSMGGGMGGGAMSAIGGGIGLGAGLLGLKGIGSVIDNLKAISPEFAGAINSLSVAFQQALLPSAIKLAEFLLDVMPTIKTGLEMFGTALGDAIEFWTVDAFNPEVWKDIGLAIADSIKDSMTSVVGEDATSFVSDQITSGSTGAQSIAAGIGLGDSRAATLAIDVLSMGMFQMFDVVTAAGGAAIEGAASL